VHDLSVDVPTCCYLAAFGLRHRAVGAIGSAANAIEGRTIRALKDDSRWASPQPQYGSQFGGPLRQLVAEAQGTRNDGNRHSPTVAPGVRLCPVGRSDVGGKPRHPEDIGDPHAGRP